VALLIGAALWQPWRGWFRRPPFSGNLDVFVSEPKNPARESLWLRDPGALPLRAGDEVRVVAKLNRPAYLYVLWLDASGKAVPLYPWIDGDWQRRHEERPAAELKLPEQAGLAYPIDPGPAGLEVVLLLAREAPLPQDVSLADLLGDLEPQPLPKPDAVAWFENFEIVRNDPHRGPSGIAAESGHPLLGSMGVLRERLAQQFPFSRAVAFGNLGGPAPRVK
jgi:hypothetical protein